MMGPRVPNYIPSFMEIGPLFPEKILKGFYHIWAWWPSWSCDPDAANKLLFPAPHIIWLWLAKRFQRSSSLKNNAHIHVNSPRAGADNPMGSKFFHKPTHGGSTQNFALICQAVWEKMFKIVVGRMTDRRRVAWIYYKLTYEPLAQVS